MKVRFISLTLLLILLLSSCSKTYEIERSTSNAYNVSISGISLADTLKLMLDGKEIYRNQWGGNTIEWKKKLLFKEGTPRTFELRTVEKDSLIATFSPKSKEKEDFNYQFIYAPEMGGLISGLEMTKPAPGMMNIKLQVNLPTTTYQGDIDIVLKYISVNNKTGEQSTQSIKTIKGYKLNSGFCDEIIELRPPVIYELSGYKLAQDQLKIFIYKSGTEEEILDTWGSGIGITAILPYELYAKYPYGSVLAENLVVAGDQEWIIIKESEWGPYYEATTLKQYFWDPKVEAPRPGEPTAQP